MPRNRIIYQSEAVFAGPSPATGFHFLSGATPVANVGINTQPYTSRVKELQRIQTANYSFNITRQDVNQFGDGVGKGLDYFTNPSSKSVVFGININY